MEMQCPNCHHVLTKLQMGQVEVDHCRSCGGTLFDPNEINRITLEDAKKLAKDKETNVISGQEKFSPHDGSPLERIDKESIPQHVTLLQSKTTGEIFAFPDDLVNFKKAQGAKLDYLKAWNIPMPALKSVLVYSFLLVTSISLVYVSSKFQSPTSQTTQASNLCINTKIIEQTENGTQVFCETKTKLECEVEIACPDGQSILPLQRNSSGTSHFRYISPECTNARIICTDNADNVVETEWMLTQ